MVYSGYMFVIISSMAEKRYIIAGEIINPFGVIKII